MKKSFFLILCLFFLVIPSLGRAANQTSLTLNQIEMPNYFYSLTFDNLVLDFSLTSTEGDILNSLVARNEGTARNVYEYVVVTLWSDNGDNYFNGFAVDNKISEGTYDDTNSVWVFDNLNTAIAANETKRFFISLETKRSGTNNKTFQFSLLPYSDVNEDGLYVTGESGIFLSSKQALPSAQQINNTYASYRLSAIDSYGPVSVMTNLKDKQIIKENSFKIIGQSKDQGGSYPDTVEICINSICSVAKDTGSYFSSWEYNWTNITAGDYSLYLKSTDLNNNSQQTNPMTVSVELTSVLPEEKKQEETITPEQVPTPEKTISETKEEIKQEVKEVKKQLRDLNKERKAIGIFGKIYKRLPKDIKDWLAVSYMAYDTQPTRRDLAKEKIAIKTFVKIFRKLPATTSEWSIVRAIAYGGVK